MTHRFVVLIILAGIMSLLVHFNIMNLAYDISPTLALGYLLLSAYCTGHILEKIHLPKVTGYIVAGLIFGPDILQFINIKNVVDLSFINSLALAFIAFCAGGELKSSNVLGEIKSISFSVFFQAIVVFIGVGTVVFVLVDFIPVFDGVTLSVKIAIALIFSVITVARSPSSTIAIISETKAQGNYTDIVLSVTIVIDVVVIMLFGITVSLCQVLVSPEGSLDLMFFLFLVFEIILAIGLGVLLGKGIIFLIERVKVEFAMIVIGMGFLVVKFSHILGDYLHETRDIALHLEPLLICMAAGFTVQNYSKFGKEFLLKLDRVSLPIYILFFAITGASINLGVLKTSFIFGVIIVVTRLAMLFSASFISGKIAGDEPRIYQNSWLGFITQAGVSLGLLAEIARRFPEIGPSIQSILVAAITINQLIGPIAFKYALNKTGEANVKTG